MKLNHPEHVGQLIVTGVFSQVHIGPVSRLDSALPIGMAGSILQKLRFATESFSIYPSNELFRTFASLSTVSLSKMGIYARWASGAIVWLRLSLTANKKVPEEKICFG